MEEIIAMNLRFINGSGCPDEKKRKAPERPPFREGVYPYNKILTRLFPYFLKMNFGG